MKRANASAIVIVKQLIKQQRAESDEALDWLRRAAGNLFDLVQSREFDEIAEDAADCVGVISQAHEAFVLSEIKLNKLEHLLAALNGKGEEAVKHGGK